jgi:hypothetical protein
MPLSKKLKRRIAAFHERTAKNEDPYWWRDPEYIDLYEEIKKEIKDA